MRNEMAFHLDPILCQLTGIKFPGFWSDPNFSWTIFEKFWLHFRFSKSLGVNRLLRLGDDLPISNLLGGARAPFRAEWVYHFFGCPSRLCT